MIVCRVACSAAVGSQWPSLNKSGSFSLIHELRQRTGVAMAKRNRGGRSMTKILSLAAVIGLLVAASSTADARGGGGGGFGGASGFAPGQSFRAFGAVAGHPGASGFAPGH